MEALKNRLSYLADRYICTLNKHDLAVAVSELNEPANDDERLLRIDNLRDAFMSENKTLSLIRTDDGFLLRFLRAKKFNHLKALVMLTNYHRRLPAWPEVFEKLRNPQLIKHVYDAGCIVALGDKAKDGSAVCIGRPGRIANSLLEDFVAAFFLTYEQLLEDETVQIYGITVIHDLTLIGFQRLMQLFNITQMKRVAGVLQECMPIRLKSLHFVNESMFCDVYIGFVALFVSQKMKKRIRFHGQSFKDLHNLVYVSVLPPAYGGTGSPIDGDVADSWTNTVFARKCL